MAQQAETHVFRGRTEAVPAHRHPNGKGWVADTATVGPNCYVGSEAEVCDQAMVEGRAMVEGIARVRGGACVGGGAVIEGGAGIEGGAQVEGRARVEGMARVGGGAMVWGDDQIRGDAVIRGQAVVGGEARIMGLATIQDPEDCLVLGPIGSRGWYLSVYRTKNGLWATAGCYSGSLKNFLAKVKRHHGSSPNGLAYREAIRFARKLFEIRRQNPKL